MSRGGVLLTYYAPPASWISVFFDGYTDPHDLVFGEIESVEGYMAIGSLIPYELPSRRCCWNEPRHVPPCVSHHSPPTMLPGSCLSTRRMLLSSKR